MRALVGPDWPVMIKLNANDFLEGSTTEDDSTYLAAALAEAGIDAIEVSGGTGGSGKLGAARSKIETEDDEAYFLPQAEAIRAAAPGVPIMLVGGVRSLEQDGGGARRRCGRLFLHVAAADPRAGSAGAMGRRAIAGAPSASRAAGASARRERARGSAAFSMNRKRIVVEYRPRRWRGRPLDTRLSVATAACENGRDELEENATGGTS